MSKVSKSKVSNLGVVDKKILSHLFESRAGLPVTYISKVTKVPTRKAYRVLNNLREEGLVENIYPIWKIVNGEVDFVSKLLESKDIFEIHDFSCVIKLIKKPEWWNKRKSRLMRLKDWKFTDVDFGKGDKNPYYQLKNNDFVIQTYPDSIIVMSRKRYYSDNPYNLIEKASKELLDLIQFLNIRFKFNFFPEGVPSIEIRSNHFNRLNDYLAKKYKQEGRRFLIKTEVGNCWIDYSEPFGKEADTPDIQDVLERQTKDIIVNKPMLPSELQYAIQQVTQNQLYESQKWAEYGRDIVEHKEAIKEMSGILKELRDEVKRLGGNK